MEKPSDDSVFKLLEPHLPFRVAAHLPRNRLAIDPGYRLVRWYWRYAALKGHGEAPMAAFVDSPFTWYTVSRNAGAVKR